MDNAAPYEVIAGPVELYVAPVGEAYPIMGATPAGGWTKVGKSGSLNFMEDGVTIANPQTVEMFRPLGSTMARKAFRTEEEVRVRVTLADVSIEAYQLALNGNAIDTATANEKKIALKRGLSVTQYTLLAIGPSAEGDGLTRQLRLNVVVQVGEVETVYQKGTPAGIALEFVALEDSDGDVGDIIDAEPLP